MARRFIRWGTALVVVAGAVGWGLTAPDPLPGDVLDGLTGDAEAGALVFAAAGCASCHVAAGVEEVPDDPALPGGRHFATDFGTFIAPNISSDPEHGIGGWTDYQIVNAVQRGISPSGQHYYPAFPYTTYARAEAQDMADLVAYLRTLPADATPSQPHQVGFPFNIRRSLGGWKWLFASDDWIVVEADMPEIERGRYLVEALGHCGECHTPRNGLGGMKTDEWLSGAPNPDGEGTIPDITPDALGWSAGEIAEYLKSGFTPDFDTAGGSMYEVVQNTARLSEDDRAAIAAYLVALP